VGVLLTTSFPSFNSEELTDDHCEPIQKICYPVGVLGAAGTALMARQNRTVEQDRAGIERLHQQDLAATFSDKLDEFTNLWDNDAVRIQPGRPAEVGKAVIYGRRQTLGSEQRQPQDALRPHGNTGCADCRRLGV